MLAYNLPIGNGSHNKNTQNKHMMCIYSHTRIYACAHTHVHAYEYTHTNTHIYTCYLQCTCTLLLYSNPL